MTTEIHEAVARYCDEVAPLIEYRIIGTYPRDGQTFVVLDFGLGFGLRMVGVIDGEVGRNYGFVGPSNPDEAQIARIEDYIEEGVWRTSLAKETT